MKTYITKVHDSATGKVVHEYTTNDAGTAWVLFMNLKRETFGTGTFVTYDIAQEDVSRETLYETV